MTRFADLNPGAAWRDEFWKQVVDDMRALLQEVNVDVLNSRGTLDADATDPAVSALLRPNLRLRKSSGLPFLSLGVGHDRDTIRVLARGGFQHGWKWLDVKQGLLDDAVKEMVKWWLDHQ